MKPPPALPALTLVLSLALLAPAAAVRAGEEAEAPAKPEAGISAEAGKALRRTCDYYAKAKSLKVEVESSITVATKDMKQSQNVNASFAARGPNQLVMVLNQGGQEVQVVCDGKKVYIYLSQVKRYQAEDAPADFAALLDRKKLIGMMAMAVDGGFTAALLGPKAYEELADGVVEGRLVGEEEVDGAKCVHLRFVQKNFDWDVWADAGDKPLLRKVAVDHTRSMAGRPGAPAGMRAEQVIVYKDWALDTELPADTFKFAPPAGSQLVRSLDDSGGGEDEDGGEEAEDELVGKPAPDFKLDLLDGGEVRLSDYKGKSAVVLDFWASWCGPCRKSLPAIIEAVEAFKDKGVVLLGLNQGETPEKVREFLAKTKLKLTVALDKGGKVGSESYGAESIPRTVVIDREGVVRAVHVGASPDLKEKLVKVLEEVLAGAKPGGGTAPGKAPEEAPEPERD